MGSWTSRVAAAWGLAAAVVAGTAAAAPPEGARNVLLASGVLDTASPAALALREAPVGGAGRHLHLVQLAGPTEPAWYAALEASGAKVVAYVPWNAYLLYGDAAAIERLRTLGRASAFVRWDGPYLGDRKLATDDGEPGPDAISYWAVQLVRDEAANAVTRDLVDRLRRAPIRSAFDVLVYRNVVAAFSRAEARVIADRPDVVSVRRWVPPVKLDERQDQILAGNLTGTLPSGPGYLAWLTSQGFTQGQFTASGFVVDLSDSGVDNGTTTPNHRGLFVNGTAPGTSRVVYNRLVGTPTLGSTLQGCDGHGNLNAHLLGGFDDSPPGAPFTDASGFRHGLGVCPFARIGSSVIFDPIAFTSPVPSEIQSRAYADGARISSNSWGFPGAGVYDVYAQAYDALARDAQPTGAFVATPGNQEMVLVFAAGNGGPEARIAAPASAKNVIAVGAAESVRSLGGADVCGVDDPLADSVNDLAPTSSRGPTSDGRRKPDLVAPGTHVTGGVPQAGAPGPTGTALACYAANTATSFGICGGVGGLPAALYFPAAQQLYTASSGTSVAAAAVSGGAALLRQFFLNNALPAPGPAMTKAMLLNAARHLDGAGAGDTLWSHAQGMGEMDLSQLFERVAVTPTVVRDQAAADVLTATGQSRTFSGTIADGSKPFRVTLAWTDAPGSTAGAAWVNDLDLTVTAGGVAYVGNVFSGSKSVPGGATDSKNNVESVFLPPGTTGPWSVTVRASNLAADAIPGGGPLEQDFALVVFNAASSTAPVLAADGSSFVAESCGPANGALDVGETVTISLALRNTGTAPTANLVATLLPTGGVTTPGPPQSYGVLAPGGPAVTRPFSFTAGGACGDLVTATLQLDDGGVPRGSVPFSFRIGTLVSQTFSYAGPPVAIPDSSPSGVDVTLSVGGFGGTLADLDFRFDGSSCDATAGSTTVGLDHTFVGDLVLTLRSPLGTTVTLANRPGAGVGGSSGNNFCQTVFDDDSSGPSVQSIPPSGAPYTGSFAPANPLAAFDGEDPNGTWTLTARDGNAGDTGNVRAFSLVLSRHTCCVGSCGAPAAPVAANDGPVHAGQALHLTATTVPGATYLWSGPNGFSSTEQNPTISATTPGDAGTYSVVAIVAGCPSAPATTNVTIVPFGSQLLFHPVTPCRIADTRLAPGPFGGPALDAGTPRTFAVGGACGVPADALAVSLNVTVVTPSGAGDLVLFPATITQPPTTTISFRANAVRANNVVIGVVGNPGAITVVPNIPAPPLATTHFVLDVNGYFR